MTPEEVRLHDLKARKGHLCRGGAYTAGVPVCGCGLDLRGVPDFMPPSRAVMDAAREQVAEALDVPVEAVLTPPPPFTHASGEPCYGCQSCLVDMAFASDIDDGHSDDPMVVADQLEGQGKEVIAAHGEVDMTPSLPLLDPTQPFGPAEIEARIIEANDRLERGAVHEANLVAAAGHLGVEYELAYARALATAAGAAADIRKAQARLATEALYRRWQDAVAAMKAMQSVTHTLRSTLSGYQSVGRSVGAMYQGPGRGR